ncbi:flavin-containing monooxygenase [Herbiconiux daphne]|uniref:NAD(P)/FAD-dependent oxidoreductase n=1 Tax=Herbiconiux daphne TaxID=2970914 RepID=A0ABT2H3M1_9MICO|nr:NAD(P)/FAD-dependent oxidoreductase [Herbiconiux daphne]MCS5734509.1 NAD(P)/FAD-dependent oxidoreductase [Herbiconiux daphne]
MTEQVEVVVIGAGFAGIGLGIRLKRRGFDSFVVLERAHDVGGTWRDNTYPGVACDVPAHLYSYSFRLNPNWSAVQAPGAEIWQYLRDGVREEGVTEHVRLNTEVTAARWDESSARWQVETSNGSWSAKFVVTACGHLSDTRLPDIEGLDAFAGELFHTARWNHGVPLEGKRVGLVGTGASAVQVLPELQRVAAEVVVFQRSAPYFFVPSGRRPEFSAAQKRLFARYPAAMRELRSEVFWYSEGNFPARVRVPALLERARNASLRYLESAVTDPELRAKLTPDYEIGCKRILGPGRYYASMVQDNVTLEASALSRIEGSTAHSAGGAAFDLDVLVFATGFDATEPRFATLIRGRDGSTLAESWSDGMKSTASISTPGFPNLFITNGANTSLGHNSSVYIIESQIDYILSALDYVDATGVAFVEATPEGEHAYVDDLARRSEGSVWLSGGCHNWYVDPRTQTLTVTWPDFAYQFREENSRFDPASYHLATRE